MVVEKVKNPGICKKFGIMGKLRGGKEFHAAPQKIGHSGEFPRNVFQDAGKKIESLRIFMLPDNLGRLYRLKKKIISAKKNRKPENS